MLPDELTGRFICPTQRINVPDHHTGQSAAPPSGARQHPPSEFPAGAGHLWTPTDHRRIRANNRDPSRRAFTGLTGSVDSNARAPRLRSAPRGETAQRPWAGRSRVTPPTHGRKGQK
ncbi:hypothetical protein GCM10018793_69800 [Streptomyces sulfonofaciens]|uniref:Uncharacterized protein n=1 Tax=Streptomyces sulfonofaciens TaxID=68272 RepID=A0A919GPX1_9ACTN|nr:hypothetical protein GCM10018793_69800 [Streptomyces sulfonofaciens]